MRLSILVPLVAALSLSLPVIAADLPTVDISAEAQRGAGNDLLRAQAYAEAADANPADVARRVNKLINDAQQTAHGYPSVKVRSSGTTTYPVYAKGGRNIESWRMRATLLLESGDAAALSELIAKLQQNLAIGSLSAAPSPDTWRKVENEVISDAIAAFQARASLVATKLQRKWRIKSMSVSTGAIRPQPLQAMARSSMAAADAVPAMQIEAGDTPITVSISGQIELLD